MSLFQSIEDVWDYLNNIPMFQNVGTSAANFSLKNISNFCDALGNPQKKYPVIHVGGTNGKGTTCYLLEKVYSDSGYKTGMFISPHLLRYNERVRVGGEEIPDSELLEFFRNAENLLEKIQLSYFEISTALAFWYFAREEVELAIIEVGLGGRLDSTNIVNPEISVITSIGLDHQNVLGNTIEKIAQEKAGIIKKNKPVVLGNISGEALRIIEKKAHQQKSEIFYSVDLEPEWNSGKILFEALNLNLSTTLKEAINKWNVACVWQVSQALSATFPLEKQKVILSIQTFKGAPGRFEKLHSDYNWYFSGSHNIQALDASLEAVNQIKNLEDTYLVFSAMKDKLNAEWVNRLKLFKKLYFVQQDGERAAKIQDINKLIPVQLITEENVQIILKELKTELVIFAGSFYFYPIVQRWISKV